MISTLLIIYTDDIWIMGEMSSAGSIKPVFINPSRGSERESELEKGSPLDRSQMQSLNRTGSNVTTCTCILSEWTERRCCCGTDDWKQKHRQFLLHGFPQFSQGAGSTCCSMPSSSAIWWSEVLGKGTKTSRGRTNTWLGALPLTRQRGR